MAAHRFRLVDPDQAPLRFELRRPAFVFTADISSDADYDPSDAATFVEVDDDPAVDPYGAEKLTWLRRLRRELVEV